MNNTKKTFEVELASSYFPYEKHVFGNKTEADAKFMEIKNSHINTEEYKNSKPFSYLLTARRVYTTHRKGESKPTVEFITYAIHHKDRNK